MLFLAALVRLPRVVVAVVGALLVVGHDALDGVRATALGPSGSPGAVLWTVLHEPAAGVTAGGVPYEVVYPVLPWVGVAALGYGLGGLVDGRWSRPARDRILVGLGSLLVVAFVVLRATHAYGEPRVWTPDPRGWSWSLLGFLDTSKYPPSLQFLAMTLGPVLLLLPVLDRWGGRVSGVLQTFGRVPLFFYLVHVLLIHAVSVVVASALPGGAFGPHLLPVYLAWAGTIVVLYPVCRAYGALRRRHPGS